MFKHRMPILLFAIILITSVTLGSFGKGSPTRARADADSLGAEPISGVHTAITGPEVSPAVTPILSQAVRDLPVASQSSLQRELAPRHNPRPDSLPANLSDAADGLAGQAGVNTGRTPDPLNTFEGVGNLAGVSPPDTNGDVGPNHYVQMVNVQFGVFDKSGTLLSGPTDFNVLFAGTGGNCEFDNAGDPVVLYDSMADRWLLSQFASPNHMCVAISQTPDPTGSYWLYEFNVGQFPDYFKFGVWTDGYYMSANENTYTAYAFDRVKMLAGQAATYQKFTGGTNLYLPSDVDGPTPPPAGAPNYFYTFKDDVFHGGADRLEVYAFHVDWVTPANSTFTLSANIPIAAYTYTVCGFFVFNCVPQAGTAQRVDAVSEWPMHRFPYRNFGAHEALLGNFTVDVGSDRSGIRWFELRKSGAGNWTLYQEGTHNPDSHHNFMGSIAMDRLGNIALGYSKSSTLMNPAIRYATRLAGDPLGTLQAEAVLFNGNGSQTGSNRWGDYSAMSIDPVDDCTFWYTNEYYPTSSGSGWHTRVGNFVLPECQGESADLEIVKSAAPGLVAPGGSITFTLQVSNLGASDLSAGTGITVTDLLPAGVSGNVSDSGDWSCGQVGQQVTCSRLGLSIGPAAPILISALAPGTSGTITNTASIASAAIDPNLGNNASSAAVTVNTDPEVDAGADQATTEGALVDLIGSYTDPDPQPAPAITWDLSYEVQITGSLTPTVIFLDDGLYTVILTSFTAIGDDEVVWIEWETASELDNAGFYVWRSLSEDGTYSRVSQFIPSEGDPLTGAFYEFEDTDVANGTRYWYKLETINLSQNSAFYGPVSAEPNPTNITWDFGYGVQITDTLTPTVIFLDNGLYTVTLTITDSLGGVGQDFMLVDVANVTPTLSMAAITQTIQSGQGVTLTGSITDPGLLDTQNVVIEWASGVSQSLNLPAGGGVFSASATYTQDADYLVSVTVTDKDGAATSQSGTVTVFTPVTERKLFLPMVVR